MKKKSKAIAIGIIVIIVLFTGGVIGKRINEENAVIKNVELDINKGNYDVALEKLNAMQDSKNKKITKLRNILYDFKEAQYDDFNLGWVDIDRALNHINNIDEDYKNYDNLKEDVEKLKVELVDIKNTREKFNENIEKVKVLIDKGGYEEAVQLSKENPEWNKIPEQDSNIMYDLHVKASELLSNQRKDNYAKEESERKEKEALEKDKQNKLKIETDENNFSKIVAQEMLDKMNAENGNTRNFYELSSDLNTDENGKKYFDVVAKDKDWIKFDDNTILSNYRLYSNGELVEVQ